MLEDRILIHCPFIVSSESDVPLCRFTVSLFPHCMFSISVAVRCPSFRSPIVQFEHYAPQMVYTQSSIVYWFGWFGWFWLVSYLFSARVAIIPKSLLRLSLFCMICFMPPLSPMSSFMAHLSSLNRLHSNILCSNICRCECFITLH